MQRLASRLVAPVAPPARPNARANRAASTTRCRAGGGGRYPPANGRERGATTRDSAFFSRRDEDDDYRRREEAWRAEEEARAAREEAQWRDAYDRRREEKKSRWNEWDRMAAVENEARARIAAAKASRRRAVTPEQRRASLARYRDMSRRADQEFTKNVSRRFNGDGGGGGPSGSLAPRGGTERYGRDQTFDGWLFRPLAGATRRVNDWLDEDFYDDGRGRGWGTPPPPPPPPPMQQTREEARSGRYRERERAPPPPPPYPYPGDEYKYYEYEYDQPPPPPPRQRGGNPFGEFFNGGRGGGMFDGGVDDPITAEEFERLRAEARRSGRR